MRSVDGESVSQTQSGASVKYASAGISGNRVRRRQVRHDDIVAKVELRPVEDPPAARAAPSTIERTAEVGAETRAGYEMARAGSWGRVKLAVENLGDQMVWHGQEVVVGGWTTSGCRAAHAVSLARVSWQHSAVSVQRFMLRADA